VLVRQTATLCHYNNFSAFTLWPYKPNLMKAKLLSLLALVLLLTGCATHNKSAAYYSGQRHFNVRYFDDNENKNKEDGRLMIYNVTLTVEARNPDSAAAQVAGLAKKYGGYVLTAGNSYTTIRVRSTSLKEALSEICTYGKVKSKDISGTDVTEEFTDYQIRLDNAETARKRYLEL
jgi:hypothetical protein